MSKQVLASRISRQGGHQVSLICCCKTAPTAALESIREDASGGVGARMYKQGSIGESILDGMEGRGSSVSPCQWGVALGGTLEVVMQTRYKPVMKFTKPKNCHSLC